MRKFVTAPAAAPHAVASTGLTRASSTRAIMVPKSTAVATSAPAWWRRSGFAHAKSSVRLGAVHGVRPLRVLGDSSFAGDGFFTARATAASRRTADAFADHRDERQRRERGDVRPRRHARHGDDEAAPR